MSEISRQAENLASDCSELQNHILKKFATAILEEMKSEILQRRAKLRILRSYLDEDSWLALCQEHPDAENWFDEDGVAR